MLGHVTCCLGNHFDIHGGMDLQFPTMKMNRPVGRRDRREHVNLWMHNGFESINEENVQVAGHFYRVKCCNAIG
jgi:cysteinyl-tRNA synthetase